MVRSGALDGTSALPVWWSIGPLLGFLQVARVTDQLRVLVLSTPGLWIPVTHPTKAVVSSSRRRVYGGRIVDVYVH